MNRSFYILFLTLLVSAVFAAPPAFAEEDLYIESLLDTGKPTYNPIPANVFEATKNEALKSKDAKTMFTIGLMYLDGKGTEIDFAQAREWLTLASNEGNSDAMVELAKLYSMDPAISGFDKNQDQAIRWIRQAEKLKNPNAYYVIGQMYEDGFPFDKSYDQSFLYYKKAAYAGVVNAYVKVYLGYQYGKGVEPNLRRAVVWLRKLVEVTPDGQMKDYSKQILGEIYFELAVKEDDPKTKFDLFQLSWQNGDKYSIDALGDLYQAGLGTKQNYTAAVDSYQESIDKYESLYAMERLGFISLKGPAEIRRDYAKAQQLFKRAADLGSAQAAYMLGYMNYYGLGMPANAQESSKWFKRSDQLAQRNEAMTAANNKKTSQQLTKDAANSSAAIKDIIQDTSQKKREIERQRKVEEKIKKNKSSEAPVDADSMDVPKY